MDSSLPSNNQEANTASIQAQSDTQIERNQGSSIDKKKPMITPQRLLHYNRATNKRNMRSFAANPNGSVEEPILIESLEATPRQDPMTSHKKPIYTIEDTPDNKAYLFQPENKDNAPIPCNLLEKQEEEIIEKNNENTEMEVEKEERKIKEENQIPIIQKEEAIQMQKAVSNDVQHEQITEMVVENIETNIEIQKEIQTEENEMNALIENDETNEHQLSQENQQDEIAFNIVPQEENRVEQNHEVGYPIDNIQPSDENEMNINVQKTVVVTEETQNNEQNEEQMMESTKIAEEIENQPFEQQVQEIQNKEINQNETPIEKENNEQEKKSETMEQVRTEEFEEKVLEKENNTASLEEEQTTTTDVQKENIETENRQEEKLNSPQKPQEILSPIQDNLLSYQKPIASICDVRNEEVNSNLLSQLDDNSLLQVEISFTDELYNNQESGRKDFRILDSETKKNSIMLEREQNEETPQILKDFRSPKKSIGVNGKSFIEVNNKENQNEEKTQEISPLEVPINKVLDEISVPFENNPSKTQEDSMLIEDENVLQEKFVSSQERLNELNILCTGSSIQETEDLLTDTACLNFEDNEVKNPQTNTLQNKEENNESAMLIEKEEKKEETYIVGRQIKPPTYLERKLAKFQEENLKSMGAFDFKKNYSKLEIEKMSLEKQKEEQKPVLNIQKKTQNYSYSSFMSDMKPHFTKLQLEKMAAAKAKEGSRSLTHKSPLSTRYLNSLKPDLHKNEKNLQGKKTVETPTSRSSLGVSPSRSSHGISPLNKKRGWDNFTGKNDEHEEEDKQYQEMKKVKKDDFQQSSLENVLAGSIKKISKIEMDKIKNKEQEQAQKEQALKKQYIESKGEVFKIDYPVLVKSKENHALNRKSASNSTSKTSGSKTNKACVYCASNIENKTQVKTLSCLHRSHIDCFVSMERKKKAKCPVCNSNSSLGLGQFGINAPKMASIKF